MKQTAVEWFAKELDENKDKTYKQLKSIFNQAKEMEKEQIMTAFTQGDIFGADFFDRVNRTAEQYYNETYESNTRI